MRRSAAELASAARAPRGCPRPRQVASGTDLQALIRHPGAATVPIGACSRSLPNGRSQLPLPRLVRSRDCHGWRGSVWPARVLARLRGGRFDVSGTLPEALEFLVPTTMCRSTPDRRPRRTLPADSQTSAATVRQRVLSQFHDPGSCADSPASRGHRSSTYPQGRSPPSPASHPPLPPPALSGYSDEASTSFRVDFSVRHLGGRV